MIIVSKSGVSANQVSGGVHVATHDDLICGSQYKLMFTYSRLMIYTNLKYDARKWKLSLLLSWLHVSRCHVLNK